MKGRDVSGVRERVSVTPTPGKPAVQECITQRNYLLGRFPPQRPDGVLVGRSASRNHQFGGRLRTSFTRGVLAQNAFATWGVFVKNALSRDFNATWANAFKTLIFVYLRSECYIVSWALGVSRFYAR